jgi:hypothetical protein
MGRIAERKWVPMFGLDRAHGEGVWFIEGIRPAHDGPHSSAGEISPDRVDQTGLIFQIALSSDRDSLVGNGPVFPNPRIPQ